MYILKYEWSSAGSANPMFSRKHAMEVDKLVKALTDQIYSVEKELYEFNWFNFFLSPYWSHDKL